MIVAAVGALLLLLQAPFNPFRQQEQSSSSTATVEGVVVRAGSGVPLPRVQVTLVRTGAPTGAPALDTGLTSAPLTVTTGADGKFVLKNVDPGSYRIALARNGYARQEYGQQVFGGQGRVVTLVPGQAVTGIEVHLVPAGTVSGVVKDSSGEPLAGAHVQLLRATYNSAGQRALQAGGGDRTNDRGEYRLYWVTPGRYYVAVTAAAPARTAVLVGGVGSPNEIVERSYPTSYYSGTVDISQASVVDIQPGVELTAVDVVVAQQEMFRVRGQIIDPITGRYPVSASVSIMQRGLTAARLGFSGAATYNPADGTFELRDVAPGSYWIRGTTGTASADSILPASAPGRTVAEVFVDSLFSDRRVAQVPIEVFSDIDAVVLTLGSGVSIPGFLSIEGQPLSAVANLQRLEVTLRPMTAGMIVNPSRHEPIGPEGAFTLENVLPGEYLVSVQSLPPDYYLKDARIEQTDALDRLLVSGPVRGALSLVLSPTGGRIDGVVLDDRRRGVPGIPAVLVPARRPARLDLYKSAMTDQAGRFVMRGIPPGDYDVFAWEALEAFQFFDEEFLRQSAPHGASIRISDSVTQRLEVKIIPVTPAYLR